MNTEEIVADLIRSYARLFSARERLVKVRAERIEQLSRLRAYLRVRLADFLANLDPMTGLRIAEMVADGSKHQGETALNLQFLDGSRLRIALDERARFTVAASPDVFDGLAFIGDLRVRADLTDAEFDVETLDDEGGLVVRTESFDRMLGRLVEHVVQTIEGQIPSAPLRTTARVTGERVGALRFSIR